MKKLDYINALRGIAIIGVIITHSNQYGNPITSEIPNKLIGTGATGVQLFYLASAFTLFLSMKTRSDREKFPLRNFFIRRFFRIAPMYYLGILYYLFQDGFGSRYWLGDATEISIANIIANLTFCHGFNPYWITSIVPGGWSIAVEMSFYALLPLLFSRIKNINQAFVFFLFSIILKLFLHILLLNFPFIEFERLWKEYLFFYLPSQLPVFGLGIIFYFLSDEKKTLMNIDGRLLLIFSGMMILQLGSGIQLFFPNHILFGMAFLIFGYSLSIRHFTFLENSIINYIGKISFSMYLVHFAVLHWLTTFNWINFHNNLYINYFIKLIIVLTSTIIISSITYNLIETPFQKLGKKLINMWENRSIPEKPVI